MNILVIDGMGGGMGKSIIEHIKGELNDVEITAVGTNSMATSSMLKAGAGIVATGENAIVCNAKKADVIIGAIGIFAANSMHGEISPNMANAVCESDALKILIPVSGCDIAIVGVAEKPMSQYIAEIAGKIKDFFPSSN